MLYHKQHVDKGGEQNSTIFCYFFFSPVILLMPTVRNWCERSALSPYLMPHADTSIALKSLQG